MPGHLTWKFGEELQKLGFEILNKDISGAVHKDRKMLTGDSPLAGGARGSAGDDDIVDALHKGGVELARRTVAKYREAMNIPSSVQRRREKRALAKASGG